MIFIMLKVCLSRVIASCRPFLNNLVQQMVFFAALLIVFGALQTGFHENVLVIALLIFTVLAQSVRNCIRMICDHVGDNGIARMNNLLDVYQPLPNIHMDGLRLEPDEIAEMPIRDVINQARNTLQGFRLWFVVARFR